MPIASAIAIGSATSLVKSVLDDVYSAAKEFSISRIAKSRVNLRDSAITKALASVTKVKTLWNVEKEVSLYDFFYPTRIEFPGGVTKPIKSLREFSACKNYVLQGTVGQGKSILLRYLSGQELREAENTGRLPLFVELRRLRADLSLDDLILKTLEKCKLPHTNEVWDYLAGTGRFILLLDAFDEIEPSLVDQAVSDIEALADLYQEKLQIIVTSRPDADIQRSTRFRVLKLAPLESQDHLPFLEVVCPDKEQAKSLSRVIASSSSDIKGLLTTPLMMTLLVILYKSLQTIPDTLPKFYEELFDVLFYRHDQSKPGFRRKRYTSLDDCRIKKLFSALCFVVRVGSHGTLSSDKLRDCIAIAATSCNETVDPDKFRDELTKTVCLMLHDGLEYSFIHKSVVQYYAASFVRGSPEAFSEEFYKLVSKEPRALRWDLELKFLSEIDTYRFMKWMEIPLLNRAAAEIGYSFGLESSESERFLRGRMFKKISLYARNDSVSESGGGDHNGLSFGGAYQVDNDPVVEVLGSYWIRRIVEAASQPDMRKDLISKMGKSSNSEFFNLTGKLRKIVETYLPDLGKDALREMQCRYERAASIVAAEEGKTKMLSALMPRG